jgi:uroporphyrin-III C-methyltransferase
MASDTPAAAIQDGTTPYAKQAVSTLDMLAGAVARAGIGSPAILVIGEVVRLAALAAEAERQRAAA